MIEWIPLRLLKELVRLNGKILDISELHANLFQQTVVIQLRVENLHLVLAELNQEQRRSLLELLKKYQWSADSTPLEGLGTDEQLLLTDYQQRVMNELKIANTLTPERLSELSWQTLKQAFDAYPDISPELIEQVLTTLKAIHTTAAKSALTKGVAAQQGLFFLPDMMRAMNTDRGSRLAATAGLLATPRDLNISYDHLLERLTLVLSEPRMTLLRRLPAPSTVFKALTLYFILDLTKQLQSLPPDSGQRQTIKWCLMENTLAVGVMVGELLGFELGPLWFDLVADQLIFDAIMFRKENHSDTPFLQTLMMLAGVEQDQLQPISNECQLVEFNLALVNNINAQAKPPYGLVLVKVPSLGPLIWHEIDESQVPSEIKQQVVNQPERFSLFNLSANKVVREAVGFQQISHYESRVVFSGFHTAPPMIRRHLKKTSWERGNYRSQTAAIKVEWLRSRSDCQENTIFPANPTGALANYRRIASVTGEDYTACFEETPVKISGPGLAALYSSNQNSSTEAAQRNLYLGFDPREGDITLLIHPSGLQEIDNIHWSHHRDYTSNASYSLTVQIGPKGYPASIELQPQLGILIVEESSRRLCSRYFITPDTEPFYLYDNALTTHIAISPPHYQGIGFTIRSYDPVTLQLQRLATNMSQPFAKLPPIHYPNRNPEALRKAFQPLMLHQVSTLHLPNKKYLQLILDHQLISGFLILTAEHVEVFSAQGGDAHQSGLEMSPAVDRFSVTILGDLQIMQGNSRLFFIGKKPDDGSVIRYSKLLSALYSPLYQLEVDTLSQVLSSLSSQSEPGKISFATPKINYKWITGMNNTAVLKIIGTLHGHQWQVILEKNGATVSQLDEGKPQSWMAIDHYTPQATLDNRLLFQQIITRENKTQSKASQQANYPTIIDTVFPNGEGDILWFQSAQGDTVIHRFPVKEALTLNGIDYQVTGEQLYAIGAPNGVIRGDQLLRYQIPAQQVGIRLNRSLAESQSYHL